MQVRPCDFSNAIEVQAFLSLLDMYAQDPMGGQTALSQEVKCRLIRDLPHVPGAISFLAWDGEQAVGVLNAFMGYSTFKAASLMNVHDIAVRPAWRGQGVGHCLLSALRDLAIERGCCKLTLEVLSGNRRARSVYQRFGFEDYALDPAAGQAMFMQMWL